MQIGAIAPDGARAGALLQVKESEKSFGQRVGIPRLAFNGRAIASIICSLIETGDWVRKRDR
jgi:hypothetical protein